MIDDIENELITYLQNENEDMALYLLRKGVKIITSPDKELHLAATHNLIEVVKFIIQEKIYDINIHDSCGDTALIRAIYNNNADIIIYLIENEADVNSKNHRRRRPLHAAMSINNVGLMEYLIKKGANINSKDSSDITPIYCFASWKNDHDLGGLEFLLRKHNMHNTVCHKDYINKINERYRNTAYNDIISMNNYIKNDIDKHYDDGGQTILHYATNWNFTNIIKYLIDRGADVGNHDMADNTPLDNVINNGILCW